MKCVHLINRCKFANLLMLIKVNMAFIYETLGTYLERIYVFVFFKRNTNNYCEVMLLFRYKYVMNKNVVHQV